MKKKLKKKNKDWKSEAKFYMATTIILLILFISTFLYSQIGLSKSDNTDLQDTSQLLISTTGGYSTIRADMSIEQECQLVQVWQQYLAQTKGWEGDYPFAVQC